MRSQSKSRNESTSSALQAAAAAIAESSAESALPPAKKSVKPVAKPSSDKHATVTCKYHAVGGSELSVEEGDEVEVMERNESGWWFVSCNGKEGWVPSSSFDAISDVISPSDSPGRSISPVAEEEEARYVTLGDFQAAADDGISFAVGQTVEVLEKAASGWWYVTIDGREGWAPSSYLEKASGKAAAPAAKKTSTGNLKSTTTSASTSSGVDSSKAVKLPAARAAVSASSSSGSSASSTDMASEISKVALKPSKSGPLSGSVKPAVSQESHSVSKGSDDGKSELSKVALKSTKSGRDLTDSKPSSSSASSSPAVAGGLDLSKVALKPVRKDTVTVASGKANEPVKPHTPAVISTSEPLKPTVPAVVRTSPKAQPKAAVSKSTSPTPMKPKGPLRPPVSATVTDGDSDKPLSSPVKAPRSPTAPKKTESSPKSSSTSTKYVAVGDYTAEDADSLSFKEGDLMELVEKSDTGWWMMKLGRKEGWAPSTYFELATTTAVTKSSVSSKIGVAASSGSPAAAGIAAQLSKIHEAKAGKSSSSERHDSLPNEVPKPKRAGPAVPKMPPAVKTNGTSSKAESSASLRANSSSSAKPPGRPTSPAAVKPKLDTKESSSEETYVVTADYAAQEKEEISLKEGQEVVVVEKADTGWWCVRVRGKEGWAPSTYLEKKKKSTAKTSSKPPRPKPAAVKKAGNRASATYRGEEGEVSFKEGESLEVVERADTGWWFVRTESGKEGWAPSTYIE